MLLFYTHNKGNMTRCIINSQNIKENPWIWDYLEAQRQKGQCIWRSQTKFKYLNTSFQFTQTVFVRERKNPTLGHAYEMMSNYIGSGLYGTVFRIACTVSQGKTGTFQVKDQSRVVKIQSDYNSLQEYEIARLATHLYIKEPVNGRMVMRQMPGQALYQFLKTCTLQVEDKLELTRTLLKAFKEQVVDNKILHNDLHTGNVFVHVLNESEKTTFTINIIDFGKASHKPTGCLQTNNKDLRKFIFPMLKQIWPKKQNTPEPIRNLLTHRPASLATYLQTFDGTILTSSSSPIQTGKYLVTPGRFSFFNKPKPGVLSASHLHDLYKSDKPTNEISLAM